MSAASHWTPLIVALLVGTQGCQRTPPRVVPPDAPARLVQPANSTHVAPGQRMPDDAVVEALQTGVYCYPFPGKLRRSLWVVGTPQHVELTEEVTPGTWRRMAVDLATGVSRVVAEDVDAGTGLPAGVTAEEQGSPQPPEGMRALQTPLGPSWLVRTEKAGETLMEPTRAGPTPVVTVLHVRWQAAGLVTGGVVASLLRQDTDNSGSESEEDEVDLCLVARAVTPVEVPARRVPMARIAVMRIVSDAVDAALGPGTLANAYWHQREAWLELRVQMPTCALDVPGTLEKLAGLADAVTAATEDGESLGIAVICVPGAGKR